MKNMQFMPLVGLFVLLMYTTSCSEGGSPAVATATDGVSQTRGECSGCSGMQARGVNKGRKGGQKMMQSMAFMKVMSMPEADVAKKMEEWGLAGLSKREMRAKLSEMDVDKMTMMTAKMMSMRMHMTKVGMMTMPMDEVKAKMQGMEMGREKKRMMMNMRMASEMMQAGMMDLSMEEMAKKMKEKGMNVMQMHRMMSMRTMKMMMDMGMADDMMAAMKSGKMADMSDMMADMGDMNT